VIPERTARRHARPCGDRERRAKVSPAGDRPWWAGVSDAEVWAMRAAARV